MLNLRQQKPLAYNAWKHCQVFPILRLVSHCSDRFAAICSCCHLKTAEGDLLHTGPVLVFACCHVASGALRYRLRSWLPVFSYP